MTQLSGMEHCEMGAGESIVQATFAKGCYRAMNPALIHFVETLWKEALEAAKPPAA